MMPTNPERMVWGMGDASGLKVVDTPAGRVGSLICWENYMPLARYALYAQGLDIFVAPTWDTGESWLATMRHIAKEAGCWVIGTATAMQGQRHSRRLPATGPAVQAGRMGQRRRRGGDQADGRHRRRTAAPDQGHSLCRDRPRRGAPCAALARRVRPLFAAGYFLLRGQPQAARPGQFLGLTRPSPAQVTANRASSIEAMDLA